MGINYLFDGSNYHGITDSLDLHFHDMKHFSKIVVDEEGSAAVGVSGSIGVSSLRSGPVEFIADHPFLYFIYDNTFNEVLFTGVYYGH